MRSDNVTNTTLSQKTKKQGRQKTYEWSKEKKGSGSFIRHAIRQILIDHRLLLALHNQIATGQ